MKSRDVTVGLVVLGLLSNLLLAHLPSLLVRFFGGKPKNHVCATPRYTVRTVSYDPLIQHIENFIAPEELEYLKQISGVTYNQSLVGHENAERSDIRNSSTAFLPDEDPIVSCIRGRAAEYQGFVEEDMIEELQLTKYVKGQLYLDHYDWGLNGMYNGTFNRETTFFAILEANCDDCGTSFPLLEADWSYEDPRWCRIVDCNATDLIVKPIPGSATFWVNLLPDGTGDDRVLHAGLPPKAEGGRKIGINIWTHRELEETDEDDETGKTDESEKADDTGKIDEAGKVDESVKVADTAKSARVNVSGELK